MDKERGISDRLRSLWLANFPRIKPTIVKVEDHDEHAFTQGLAFADGILYESTGLQGASSLRKLTSGSIQPDLIRPLNDHWAEGIAYINKEITQLTWKSGLAFVYTCPDLEFSRAFEYTGEGWGLAAFGEGFVMTDGSEWLTFRDARFNITRRLRVNIRRLPLKWLNDLESVDGYIYANRLGDSNIYKICSVSGAVSRIIDCSELVKIAAPGGPEDFLNGIAFLSEEKIFALTGKRWSKLFYVKINGN